MSSSERACPSCSASLPSDAEFCMKCGTRVSTAPAQAASDPLRAALTAALGSQYEIIRLLGRGGMGAVYLARELALDRLVAVKVLPPEASDEQTRERFKREARTAAKLTHPNIVPLHSFGDSDGMLYFVMGYVRGESLADRMRRDGALPPVEVRRLLGEIAGALDYAHRQGVVHRDIKPDNVLVDDESGRPMLTDFGVAKARASGATLTEMGMVVGTPHYMSPEQASGDRALDGRSDLYSLGVMGYAMLAGRLPFESGDLRELIVQHVTKDPEPLRKLQPAVPADLATAVERCLAKDPDARWPDARRMRMSLRASEDDDDDLAIAPMVQSSLDGIVPKLTPLVAGLGVFTWWSYLFPGLRDPEAPWWAIPALMGWMVALALGGFAGVQRFKGTSWREIARLVMRQPRNWPLWFPKRWRRKGDVWDRLPAPLKRARVLMGASYLMIVPILVFETLRWREWFANPLATLGATGWSLVRVAAMLGGMVGATLSIRRWARAHGLNPQQTMRIALAPSGNVALWRKPQYAEILLPPAHDAIGEKGPSPRTPHEYLQAIVGAVAELTGPTTETGSDAVSGARQLVAGLEGLQREIEMLARDGDSADAAGIERKLEALGPETADDRDERRQMRRLLSGQLEVARRLGVQLDRARAQEVHLTDLLKILWLRVAELRAQSMRDVAYDDQLSGKVRAVCEDIERYVAGAEEADRVVADL